MINPAKQFNLHDYLEVFLRRLWYFVIPFAAVIIGAGTYAVIVPKEYRASTLILVTPQKVPEDFIRPTVTSRIEDRLQSIGQEIMSRTRLEQVINEFKLYQEEAKSLRREETVELMQKNIQVQIKGKEGRGEYQGFFTIAYIGKDPRVVTLVTNKLASLFIEENLKLREQQAQGTSEFLSIELNATKAKLEELEGVLAEFKIKYMGELPEQREANLRVLDQLQLQSQRIGDGIKAAQDRRILIQKQLQDYEMLIATATQSLAAQEEAAKEADSSNPSSPAIAGKPKNPYTVQLGQYQNHLSDLQAKYTEKHPDILLTKKKIADLEAKSAQFEASQGEEEKTEKGKPSTPAGAPGKTSTAKRGVSLEPRLNPRYKELENQIISVDMEIERLKQDDAKLRNQIALYRQRIENTPSREQTLAVLTRDYSNTREAYATLQRKSQAAQQAENLERRQKGEQFKILDPARIPEKPYRPDIPKILLIGLALGFFGGAAVAFLREQMDRSFRDAEDLQVALGFKVLANIPRIGVKAN